MDCNQTGRTCVIKFSPAIYTTSSWIVLPQFRRTFARLIIYEPQRPINVFLSWHGIPGAHTGYNCAANVNGRLVVAQRAVAHRAGQTVRATVFHRTSLSLSLHSKSRQLSTRSIQLLHRNSKENRPFSTLVHTLGII